MATADAFGRIAALRSMNIRAWCDVGSTDSDGRDVVGTDIVCFSCPSALLLASAGREVVISLHGDGGIGGRKMVFFLNRLVTALASSVFQPTWKSEEKDVLPGLRRHWLHLA